MSVWSHITGIVHLEKSVTETELIACYNRYSHYVKGSEGGLTLSFTREVDKTWEGSREYHFEPYTKITNMVIQGSLRSVDDEALVQALDALKEFLYILREQNFSNRASFTLECDASEHYYQLVMAKGRIRSQKIKIKFKDA